MDAMVKCLRIFVHIVYNYTYIFLDKSKCTSYGTKLKVVCIRGTVANV